MSKIYKLVWSKVRNCYVAVSELAKSRTKAPKSGMINRVVVAGVLACVLSCGAVVPVMAAGSEFSIVVPKSSGAEDVYNFTLDSNLGIDVQKDTVSHDGVTTITSVGALQTVIDNNASRLDGIYEGDGQFGLDNGSGALERDGNYLLYMAHHGGLSNVLIRNVPMDYSTLPEGIDLNAVLEELYQHRYESPQAAAAALESRFGSRNMFSNLLRMSYTQNGQTYLQPDGTYGNIPDFAYGMAVRGGTSGLYADLKELVDVLTYDVHKSNMSLAVNNLDVNNTNSNTIVGTGTVTGKNSIAVGTGHQVSGNNSGAFGDPDIVDGDNSYVVGNNSSVAAGTSDVFVLGNDVSATGTNTVVLGTGSDGSQDNVVSVGSSTNKRRIVNVAAGTSDTDAVNVKQLNDLMPHYFSVQDYPRATVKPANYNNDGATDENYSMAIGAGTTANARETTAVGYGNTADGAGSVTIGHSNKTESTAAGGMAIGVDNTVDTNGALALGGHNKALGFGVMSVGISNTVEGNGNGAFGEGNIVYNNKINDDGTLSSSSSNGSFIFGADNKIYASNASAVFGNNGSVKNSTGSMLVSEYQSEIKNSNASYAIGNIVSIEDGNASVVIGDESSIKNDSGSVLLGHNSSIDDSNSSVALGTGVTVRNNSKASVAIGQNSIIDNSLTSVAIASGTGSGVKNSTGSVAIGQATNVTGSTASVAIGDGSTVSGGSSNVAIGQHSSVSSGLGSYAFGDYSKVVSSSAAMAVGNRAVVENSDGGSSFGNNVVQNSGSSMAVGVGNTISGVTSYIPGAAFGVSNHITGGDNAIAVGYNSTINDSDYGSAFGAGNILNKGMYNSAFGYHNEVSSESGSSYYSTAMGANNKVANGDKNGAIGLFNEVSSTQGSVAVGEGNKVSGGESSAAMGVSAMVKDSQYATSVGYGSTITESNDALALGVRAKVNNTTGGFAIGNDSHVDDGSTGAVAIGPFSFVDGQSTAAVAMGSSAHVSGSSVGSTAIGNYAYVSGTSLGASVVGSSAHVNESNASNAFGNGANVNSGSASTAVGTSAYVTNGEGSDAFGNGASIQDSAGADALGAYASVYKSGGSTAIGNYARVSEGGGSIAAGNYASVSSGGGSAAFGPHATVSSSDNGMALGSYSKVQGVWAGTAIGHSAETYAEQGVALGSNSKADRGGWTPGYDPYGDSIDYSPVWMSTAGAVSVGGKTFSRMNSNGEYVDADGNVVEDAADAEQVVYTRQITNVAAGSALSDAVNVAQLKAVADTAVRFVGVKSTDKSDSNYKGGGAVALNSVAIGPSASALSVISDDEVSVYNEIASKGGWNAVSSAYKTLNGWTDEEVIANIYGDKVLSDEFKEALFAGTSEEYMNTAANAINGVALGYQASVTKTDSVALGSKSVADEVGVVSVGSNELKRRIVNVAEGTADTDAVNVKQLRDAVSAIPEAKVYTGSSNIDISEDGVVSAVGVVEYDAGTVDKATLKGTTGTTLANVKNGLISKTSRDAINGGQLWLVKEDIKGFAADIERNTNSIQTLNGSVSNALASVAAANTLVNTVNDLKADASLNNLSDAGKQVISSAAIDAVQQYMANQNNSGSNSANPNTGMSTNHSSVNMSDLIDDLADNDGTVGNYNSNQNRSGLSSSLKVMSSGAAADTNFVVYDDADASQITLEDATGEGTKITNLAEGSLSAASTDAVNGSQLYKTNRDVAAMQETLSTNNGTVAALQTDTQTLKTNMITLQSQYATTKTQVENGFNVTVDGAKVKTVNPDSAYMDFATGNHTEILNDNGSVRINVKDDGQVANGNSGLVTGNTVAGETRVAGNGNYILKGNSAAQNLSVLDTVLKETRVLAEAAAASGEDANAVHYDAADHSSIILGGENGTLITNLKDGAVTADSTDAVTGKQLFATNEKLDALDALVGTVDDGDYVSADKSMGENINVLDGQLKTVSDGLDTVRTDVAVLRTDVDDLNDKVTGFEVELDGKADTDLGNLTDTGKTVISDIAKESVKVKGAGLANVTSAENGNTTVYTVNVQADGKVEENNTGLVNGGTVYNSINAVRDEFAEDLDGKTDLDLSNISDGGKTVIREVMKADLAKKADKADLNKKANVDASNINVDAWAAKLGTGEVAEGNTGLVNGGTVYDAIQRVDRNNNIVEIQDDVIYMGAREGGNVISVYNNEGEGRVITGVITNPEDSTSAANVGYVNAVGDNIVNGMNKEFNRMNNKISDVGANAAAMASLTPGGLDGDEKFGVAAAVGNYRNATAGAVGLFYKPQDNIVMNARASFGTNDNMLGAGVYFGLNKGNTPGVTKATLIRAVNAQAAKLTDQDAVIANQNAEISELKSQMAEVMKELAVAKSNARKN